MKTKFKLTILAALTLAAAGCNKEMQETGSAMGTPVKFNMTVGGIGSTKTTTSDGVSGNRAVGWRNGDAVGILVDDQTTVHQYVYEESGDGIWKEALSTDAIYAAAGSSYDFTAYYPYSTDVVTANGFTISAKVLADQNALYGETQNTGYDMSDVLYAYASNISYEQAVSGVALNYSHAFAMVEVLVSGSEVAADAPDAVRLRNIRPSANIDLMTQTISLDETVAATDIVMCCVEKPVGVAEGSYLYRAIVPAQTVTAGNSLLEIDGVGAVATYVFKAPASGVAYEQGKYRRIEATIGQGTAGLTFPAGSIDSWEASGALDPVEGEEKEVDLMDGYRIADLTSLQVYDGAPSDYFYKPTAATYISTPGWAFARNGSDLVGDSYSTSDINAELVTDDPDGQCIKISGPCSTWSWSRSALIYHHIFEDDGLEVGYYRLSFKVKTDEALTKDPVIFVHTASSKSTSNGLFMMHNATSTYPYRSITVTTDWTDITLYFNLARAKDTVYSSETYYDLTVADYNESNQVDVVIMPLRSGVDAAPIKGLYIKDASFVKVTEAEFNGTK